jgi:ubiquinone/menaquinone biosynthesis C-methylase UbiE
LFQPRPLLVLSTSEKSVISLEVSFYHHPVSCILKNTQQLRAGLKEAYAVLKEIKEKGKQDYLKKDHANFSRIMHDYSDAKSSFVSWKGMLEMQLV